LYSIFKILLEAANCLDSAVSCLPACIQQIVTCRWVAGRNYQ